MNVAPRLPLILSAWATLAAISCNGYSDGSIQEPSAREPGGDVRSDAGFEQEADAATDASVAPLSPEPEPEPLPVAPAEPAFPSNVMTPPLTQPVPSDANLLFARSRSIDGYLTDRFGNPLYMYAGDVTGAADSACLGDCARDWPPFDVGDPKPGPGIESVEISRFHRQDGSWQTTYKGHALYYRASEAGTGRVTGDGVDGRWFVARDYLAFLSSARSFTPSGATIHNDLFLTDGFGRTLYVCLNDTPRTPAGDAIASCDEACTRQRPIFAAAETARTTVLPSVISPVSLSELVRPDRRRQLTYRGWPLYYFSGDAVAGATEGHNDRAWRAIDPVTFGLVPALTAAN